jgi:hypothetical protein
MSADEKEFYIMLSDWTVDRRTGYLTLFIKPDNCGAYASIDAAYSCQKWMEGEGIDFNQVTD